MFEVELRRTRSAICSRPWAEDRCSSFFGDVKALASAIWRSLGRSDTALLEFEVMKPLPVGGDRHSPAKRKDDEAYPFPSLPNS